MHPDFLTVIEAVRFAGPEHYHFQGQPRDVANLKILYSGVGETPLAGRYTKVVQVLESDIYTHLYKNQAALPEAARLPPEDNFLLALSGANCGTGTWETGWELLAPAAPDERLVVSNGRLRCWAGPTEVQPLAGQPLRPGSQCRVRVGKEVRRLNPHYYMAFGNEPLPDSAPTATPLMRYYWHLTPAGAVPYMAAITQQLNALHLPFRTKVLADPAHYGPADAGVLYVGKQHRAAAEAAVLAVHEALAGQLLPGVPLFTQALRPGLGYAEDPADGLSFGLSRARLLAYALADCAARGLDATADKLRAIEAEFRAAGFDPARPYYHRAA